VNTIGGEAGGWAGESREGGGGGGCGAAPVGSEAGGYNPKGEPPRVNPTQTHNK